MNGVLYFKFKSFRINVPLQFDEIKEKLFEKFIRADNEMTRTTRGTGLGLYIVKGICEALNIEISLNAGEDFVITLKFNDYVK